jgi:Fe-S-cluster containining protein
MAREIKVPEARFSCQSCGRCCTMWTVTADASKVERLRKQDWGGPDPFLPLRGEGDPFKLRMEGGRCFFLGDDNRCRIHNEVGYNSKPEGCKAFPLHVGKVAGQTRVRLSFYCPAVSANKGKRLGDQMRWVRSTVKAAGAVTREAALTLDDELEITVRDLEALEAGLVALLEQRDHALNDRLAAGAALLQRVRRATAERGKGALLPTVEQARGEELAKLAKEGRQGGSSSRGGPVLSLFLGQDCAPSGLSRAGRFFGVRLFNLGLGRLSSRLMGGKASMKQIRGVELKLTEESDKLITRYLLHKLRARRTLAGELSIVSGFNLLVTAYAVTSMLARLRAAHEGRDVTDHGDVERAIQAADLLVVEHTAIYQASMLATLAETVLAQDNLCASLLARIGE